MGKRLAHSLGIGQTDLQQYFRGALFRPFVRKPVGPQGLFDLAADPQQRVQRTHGVLVDHGDLAPAHFAKTSIAHCGQVLAIEQNLSAQDTQRRAR